MRNLVALAVLGGGLWLLFFGQDSSVFWDWKRFFWGRYNIDLDPAIWWAGAGVTAFGTWAVLTRISIEWGRGRGAFGKARWAGWLHLWWAGMFKRDGGLFLGRVKGRDIYQHGEGHLLTVGGAGGGKSTGLVVPALLELRHGSVIVTDPSGELTAMTKRHRETVSRVIVLNPFASTFERGTGLDFPDDGFNPMSMLKPELPDFKADCDALASALMVTGRQASESYWNDEGKAFLSLVLAATVLYEKPKSHHLAHVYRRVREGQKELADWLDHVVKKDNPAIRDEATGFLDVLKHAPEQWRGISRKAASATERYAPTTPLGEHVQKNGFDAEILKTEDVTVYILVPPGQLKTALPWMNTLLSVFGTAIGRPSAARQVTMLIDEAPSLGYMPDLVPFLALFRKAGLRIWLFTQTLSQLAAPELYGSEGVKTIMGQASVKQFFAIREKDTAQMISDMAGERTARNARQGGSGETVGEVGVPLIRAELVRALKRWEQVLILDGVKHPIKGKLVPFFKRRSWRRLTDSNPYRRE